MDQLIEVYTHVKAKTQEPEDEDEARPRQSLRQKEERNTSNFEETLDRLSKSNR